MLTMWQITIQQITSSDLHLQIPHYCLTCLSTQPHHCSASLQHSLFISSLLLIHQHHPLYE